MSETKPVKVDMAMTRRGVVLDSPDALRAFAMLVVQSGAFKKWGNMATAAIALQTGLELGFTPVRALKALYVVPGGEPELTAQAAAALIRQHSDSYEVGVTGDGDARHGFVVTKRGGQTHRSAFSLDEATRAGLAGKGVWKSYTDDMLIARATSRHAKHYYSDVTLGLEVKEVMDDLPASVRNVPAAQLPAPSEPDPLLSAFEEPTTAQAVEAAMDEIAAPGCSHTWEAGVCVECGEADPLTPSQREKPKRGRPKRKDARDKVTQRSPMLPGVEK